MMDLDIKQDCNGVDWKSVSETLKSVGMGYHDPDVHRRAFEASHTTIFVYTGGNMIGFGRAISDGAFSNIIIPHDLSAGWPRL
jgi:hypothetical protein